MPHNADFFKLQNINTIEIHCDGWIFPLFIEYGITDENRPQCFWRVKGTSHTFTIPIIRLDYLSEGDYAKHFTEILESFREQIIQWKSNSNPTNWMLEYINQYLRYIVI